MEQNEFINPKWTIKNSDRFYHRKSLFLSLNEIAPKFNGKLLDVGCGKMPYRDFIHSKSNLESYIGLDIESALEYDQTIKPDVLWDGITMPFQDNTFDVILATEVFEHCPDLDKILSEIYRVLKPGGMLYFTVPFLWSLHEVPYDIARYTPFALNNSLEKNKFINAEIKALGGWHASFAQMISLWNRRAIGRRWIKNVVTLINLPLVVILIRLDKIPKQFKNGQMCTGFSGVAFK